MHYPTRAACARKLEHVYICADIRSHLDEANVSGVLPEALTADVQVVLADDTALVAADFAAVRKRTRIQQGEGW